MDKMLNREVKDKGIKRRTEDLVFFFSKYYKKVILYYLLALKKERKNILYLIVCRFLINIIEFLINPLKGKGKIAIDLNKKIKELSLYTKDLDKEIYNLSKYLQEFEEERLREIISYDKIEELKRKVYKTGNIEKVISDYFKELLFCEFKKYLLKVKNLEDFLVENYFRILEVHWYIISKRIREKTKGLPYNRFKFGLKEQESVFYFNREILFSGEGMGNNMFYKWLELMIFEEGEVNILFLDIDDFKGVNSIFSHVGGDIVLGHLMNLFNEYYSENDGVWFRYGGEEFILIFKNKDEILHFLRFIFSKTEKIFLFNIDDIISANKSCIISRFIEEINKKKEQLSEGKIINVGDDYKAKILSIDKDNNIIKAQFYEMERKRFLDWIIEIDKNEIYIQLNMTCAQRNIRDLNGLIKIISDMSSEVTKLKSSKKEGLKQEI